MISQKHGLDCQQKNTSNTKDLKILFLINACIFIHLTIEKELLTNLKYGEKNTNISYKTYKKVPILIDSDH